MSSANEEVCVELAVHERARLSFAASDEATETGWPARFRFHTTFCEGESVVGLFQLSEFCDALDRVHRNLSAEARLATYEHDFELTVRRLDSLGHMLVEARLERWAPHPDGDGGCELTFNFSIDQSFLPSFASGLRKLHQVSQ